MVAFHSIDAWFQFDRTRNLVLGLGEIGLGIGVALALAFALALALALAFACASPSVASSYIQVLCVATCVVECSWMRWASYWRTLTLILT